MHNYARLIQSTAALALFTLLAVSYLALGAERVRQTLRAALHTRPHVARMVAGPVVLLASVAAYALLAGLPLGRVVASYGIYLFAPALVLGARAAKPRAPWGELVTTLALWLPIELHLLPPLLITVPVRFDVQKLVGLVDAMYLFLLACPLDGIGYTFRLRSRDVSTALVAFAVYAVVAVPVGLATGFLVWHPQLTVTRLVVLPPVIYLITAVPEEFLFRGLIQNLLARPLGKRAALVLASVVFGLAHLPDPRYAVLAAVAGLAYGWVYDRTDRITASAITHALVDAVWGALLRV